MWNVAESSSLLFQIGTNVQIGPRAPDRPGPATCRLAPARRPGLRLPESQLGAATTSAIEREPRLHFQRAAIHPRWATHRISTPLLRPARAAFEPSALYVERASPPL